MSASESNPSLFDNIKAWPVLEAKRILKKIENKIPDKGYVLFCTGYGPSGWPHMGTFGEVVRTNFVRFAFKQLAPHIPTRLVIVSDDLDALRKVPENIPNREMLKKYIDVPLTSIPDPYGQAESFGDFNNNKLKEFLDAFGFEYEFLSAKKFYQSGDFDEYLMKAANNYDKLMELMLPTLGPERRATYSPFMPIDPDTGKVVSKGVISIQPSEGTITYKNQEGEIKTSSFLKGGAKLQWKCDFGVRWAALGVDYEIYGKDHYPNESLYRSICKAMDVEPPVNFFYEHFIDKDGVKLSKSKGNEGVSMETWTNMAPIETMAYYMYIKPQTAKKLYFDIVPKMVDEYLQHLNSYHESDTNKLENPLFYIHGGNIPHATVPLSFSLLLNVSTACNAENEEIIWGFLEKYYKGKIKKDAGLMATLVKNTVYYYNYYVKPQKFYHIATPIQKKALLELKTRIESADKNLQGDELATTLQNITYDVGNDFSFVLKDWFKAIYQILLGSPTGPRVGSFMALYGVSNSCALITDSLTRQVENPYFSLSYNDFFETNILSKSKIEDFCTSHASILEEAASDSKISNLFDHSFADNIDLIEKWTQEVKSSFPSTNEIKTIAIIGIGGSSLALQSFYDIINQHKNLIRLVFIENIDPVSFHKTFESLIIQETLFIAITKSGGTLETVMQSWFIAQKLEKILTPAKIARQFIVITENTNADEPNDIQAFCHHYSIKSYPWSPGVSGRFSAFTVSSLLPLRLMGVNLNEIKKSLYSLTKPCLHATQIDKDKTSILEKPEFAPFIGAAVNFLLYKKNYSSTVFMPYNDQMNKFSMWIRQLWSESIGKKEKGTTPLCATGTTDQHSIMQLFLSGPKDKFYNFFSVKSSPFDMIITSKHAPTSIKDKSATELLVNICSSACLTLAKSTQPVRHFEISSLNLASMTALMGHFMLETIYFVYFMNKEFDLNINPFDQPGVEIFKETMYENLNKIKGK